MFRSDRMWHGWTIVQNMRALLTLRFDYAKNASTLARLIIYPIILCHSTRHMMGKKSMYRFFFLSYYSWERSFFLNAINTRKDHFFSSQVFSIEHILILNIHREKATRFQCRCFYNSYQSYKAFSWSFLVKKFDCHVGWWENVFDCQIALEFGLCA